MLNHGARDGRFRVNFFLLPAVSAAALCCAAGAYAASSCEDLAHLKLPDTTIETAQSVPAGDYTTPDKVARKAMPAFCRVVASVKARARFRHPDRDVAAERGMDRRLPRQRQRRLRRHIRLGYHGHGGRRSNAAMRPRTPTWERRRQRRSTAIRSSAIRRNGRTGDAVDPCDDGRRQGYRQGVLWRGAEALLLHRLLDRRPAGADRSAILSRRLRRRPYRRAGRQPDLGPRRRGVGLHRREPASRAQALRRQARACSTRPPSQPAAARATGSSRTRSSPTRPACDFDPANADLPGRGFAPIA